MYKYSLISITLALLILTGCSGSKTNAPAAVSPFTFIEPITENQLSVDDSGGSDPVVQPEDIFTPHPLIPLEENISDNNSKEDVSSLESSGMMYDFGLEIENAPISDDVIFQTAADPMLESIRQDLMIKWGIDEIDTKKTTEISVINKEIDKRITSLENDMKGDFAALRSENLMLLSRLQKLEKRSTQEKTSTKKTKKALTKPKRSIPTSKAVVKKPVKVKTYNERYDSALADYKARKFRAAITAFQVLIKLDRRHSLADNAQYWIGECYYHMALYDRAVVEFGKVSEYKNSNKFDSAILMQGKAYKHLGQKRNALTQFKTLLAQYPRSAYSKRARELISDLEKS